ncbi:glycosyltransferase involved in cell wall biosynthesis [Constrictibacter sp. MBR-5]|jgi:glycosyltransferase involved in cell wall biosynthesis|uniref:glycosyltransferase family 4 protein n=1 Tax=Constrictibacter sp. MBR-5 TaxID=3156467 RepID=UPI0033920955
MLRRPLNLRRILLTVDAVGGVWRYGVDVARGMAGAGVGVVLVGSGPPPSPVQRREVEAIPGACLDWLDAPLDWMADAAPALAGVPGLLAAAAERHGADLLHLNAPSQALGLPVGLPFVVVSHSCVHTWWQAVRSGAAPAEWGWRHDMTRAGFDAARLTLAPTASHARALVEAYGKIGGLKIVPNAAAPAAAAQPKEPFVFAAGRWWDEGKNGRVLDEAAGKTAWPIVMAGAVEGPLGQRFAATGARMLGPLDAAAVRAEMGRAAVFAAPSLYEPFGLAVLEAALSRAALVLADIPTFRELWGGAALFAAPRDPAAFARAIDALASDESLRRDLGARARTRAASFTIERQTTLLMEAYAGAMAGAASGRCDTRQPEFAEVSP